MAAQTGPPVRADHAVRHNAAVGALVGLAVGDALADLDQLPPRVCDHAVELPAWGSVAEQSFANAERLLSGEPVAMDLTPAEVVAPAIALADPDATPPLLVDPDAVMVCAAVRQGLLGMFDLDPAAACDPVTSEAIRAATQATSFAAMIQTVTAPARPLASALTGLRWGAATIPASWVTTVSGPVGHHRYGLRQVRRLAERLMQQEAPSAPEPRRALGPREVAPGLWLSNLHAVPKFLGQHPDGAVLSLCPTTGAFDNHLVRREFALHDAPGKAANPLLKHTLDEVLETIEAMMAAERPVLVHCHHGASRTGLVLRCWLMRTLGLSAEDATTEAQVRWPKTSTWNRAFNAEVERRGS